MDKEIAYTRQTDINHIKAYGQYFTNFQVADFMCRWACAGAETMLDPAAGNGIFLKYARQAAPECHLTGYEIDAGILDFFGRPAGAEMINADYLLNGWDRKYNAIVCNPPYNRFQAVANRDTIIAEISHHTGFKYSSYTNLYVLFLIKSIFQMAENGRLAYIIPTEFLNSKYGTVIKRKMLEEGLLKAIINFRNDSEMFFNATTTSCLLLLDRTPKSQVLFYDLESISGLSELNIGEISENCLPVSYADLDPESKWRNYLWQEEGPKYTNLTDVSTFCRIARGIATGANDFFCLSHSRACELGLPESCLTECICRSADVKGPIFTRKAFEALAEVGRTVYLLDVREEPAGALKDYIDTGEAMGLSQKILLSVRHPWYSMEQKPIAPIWVSSACREGIKFVRNLAGLASLTTFHSVYINSPYEEYTDLIFCYFLTPVAQDLLRANRKELGNGLEKFQPSDLKTAKMLDITLVSTTDRDRIKAIYQDMVKEFRATQTDELNAIFASYLIP